MCIIIIIKYCFFILKQNCINAIEIYLFIGLFNFYNVILFYSHTV